MSAKQGKTHELRNRILFTLLILAVYLIGRNLVLVGIDVTADSAVSQNAQDVIVSMMSGDRYQDTVLALGIMPGITAAIIVQFALIFMGKERRKRFSKRRTNRITAVLLLIIAVIYAAARVKDLPLKENLMLPVLAVQIIDFILLVLGACAVYQMGETNKKHGIGGQSVLFVLNIVDSIVSTVLKYKVSDILYPALFCLGLIGVTVLMETFMVRIPVQRVSIHNEYADKDYLAFKLNPIGVMPVMFATVIFMLPQLLLTLTLWIWPGNSALQTASDNMVLTKPLGVSVYLGIIVFLTIFFTLVMLNPADIAEGLQRSGDSIVNVYAGKPTGKYLFRRLLLLSIFSGLVLCAGMSVSMTTALLGMIPEDLAMLPASLMILTGMVCTVIQEIGAHRRFDSYRFII